MDLIATLNLMTFIMIDLIIMFSINAQFGIMGLILTLNIKKSSCCVLHFLAVILNVVILSVIILGVIMLNAVMLSAMAKRRVSNSGKHGNARAGIQTLDLCMMN
jgi:hypothetical protein